MNTYKLEGTFIVNIKANSYDEAIDIFDNNLSGVDVVYTEYITKYNENGNEIGYIKWTEY